MIAEGSTIKVVNTGAVYSSYTSYVKENGYADLIGRYTGCCNRGWTGKVLYSGNHLSFPNTPVCIVEINDQNQTIVVIGDYGLKVIAPPESWDCEIEKSESPLCDFLEL